MLTGSAVVFITFIAVICPMFTVILIINNFVFLKKCFELMFTFSTLQIASAIKEVVSKAGGDLTPHILCGDFNSEVTSPGYQLCTEGYLSDACIQQLQSLENLQFQDGTVSRICTLYLSREITLIFEIWFLLNHWNF